MFSTRYIILFTLALTSVVALGLSGLFYATYEQALINERLFNKRGILMAVEPYLQKPVEDMSDEEVLEIFRNNIEQNVLDMNGQPVDSATVEAAGHKGGKAEDVDLKKERKKPEAQRLLPLFIYQDGNQTAYIMSVRGNGLWDEIWGNVAVQDDFNTLVGAAFDHQAETPGLGAEIKDNPAFRRQFQGKELYNDQGEYVSVDVRKGGAKVPDHEVDGISGATITSDGVSEMLYRGIRYYEPYFEREGANQLN